MTLMQAELVFSDSTRVCGRRLAAEFRGFAATYCAGPGRKLGSGESSTPKGSTSGGTRVRSPGCAEPAEVTMAEQSCSSSSSEAGDQMDVDEPRIATQPLGQVAPGWLGPALEEFIRLRTNRSLPAPVTSQLAAAQIIWAYWSSDIDLGRKLQEMLPGDGRKAIALEAKQLAELACTFRKYCFACIAAFGDCGRSQSKYQSARPGLLRGSSRNRVGERDSSACGTEAPPDGRVKEAPKIERPEAEGEATQQRRVRGKQTCDAYPCPELPDVDEFVVRAMSPEHSPDPRCAFEAEVARVRDHMRRCPLLPNGKEALVACDLGVDLPNAHCAFSGCDWSGDTEDELREHVKREHMQQLRAAVAHFPGRCTRDEAIMCIYTAALSMRCQTEAPVACLTLSLQIPCFYEMAGFTLT